MAMKGSVAIVTGGACGIGAALCKSLLSRGIQVSIFLRKLQISPAIHSFKKK